MIPAAQLIAFAQQAARPATSPIPSFFAADLRKAHPRATKQQAQQQQQQHQASRLRPLPQRCGALAEMMIEGSKTGEEKPVTIVERREPPTNAKPPLSNEDRRDSGTPMFNIVKEQQKIRRLEQELKKANETIRQKNIEIDGLQEGNKSVGDLLEESRRMLSDQQRQHQITLNASKAEVDSLRKALDMMESDINRMRAEDSRRSSLVADAQTASEKALHAKESEFQSRCRDYEKDNNQLRDEAKNYRAAMEDMTSKLAGLKDELEKKVRTAKEELLRRDEREQQLRCDVEETKSQLCERDTRMCEWKKRIEACNAYIVKICQPQFSVVRDETLTPIPHQEGDPSSSEAGFVLVPLPLLLEGYALLPPDTKRKIAEDYEQSKKSGRSATIPIVGVPDVLKSSSPVPVVHLPDDGASGLPRPPLGGKAPSTAPYSLRHKVARTQ